VHNRAVGMRVVFEFGVGGVIAALTLQLAACSGDKSSDDGCRAGRSCNPATGKAGGGGTGAAAGTTAGSGGTSDFGNSEGGVPMNIPQDDASTGPGETTEGDNPLCGGHAVEPMVEMETIPGNILLIFDKSGSMTDPWSGGANEKWIDAKQAVVDAIMPLQTNVNVGLIFFPHPAGGGDSCYVPPHTAAPQMNFTPGADFLVAWNAFWAPVVSDDVEGNTPLSEGLQAADALLQSATLEGTTTVVVITDGAPNCSNDDDAPVADQVAYLDDLPTAWLMNGIKTHVVGLPGGGDADETQEMIDILNGVAAAGGTTQHISAADPAALQTELAAIIGMSVTSNFTTCSIGLPEKPPNLDDVHLVVVERGVEQDVANDLGASGGWTLAADGSEIVLEGHFCELAKQGQYEKISVVFGCVELPPLDPPPVPE
jgi:hypothetical protein